MERGVDGVDGIDGVEACRVDFFRNFWRSPAGSSPPKKDEIKSVETVKAAEMHEDTRWISTLLNLDTEIP
jgi:hypothetical protein